MPKRPQTVQCAGRAADGSPCGRRALATAPFQLCSKHQPGATHTGIIAANAAKARSDDPMETMRHLTKSNDPRVRLRAATFLIELAKKMDACLRCASAREMSVRSDEIIRNLTDGERDELRTLLLRVREIKDGVWLRLYPPTAPTLQSVTDDAEAPDAQPEPPPVERRAPRASRPVVDDAEAESTNLVPAAPSDAECGLFEVNGHLTHGLGDDYANRILSGQMTREQAKADHDAALAHSASFMNQGEL